MLVFTCQFCGAQFSQANGPFIWIQPVCFVCGSNQVNMSDEPDQPSYDYEELQELAEIGREALSAESEFVEVPTEEEKQLKVQPTDGILTRMAKKIKRE